MATAAQLIASGKAAVEAELSVIENDFESAKEAMLTKKAAIAQELQTYMQTHAAEVSTAQSLISRATADVAAVTGTVKALVPAATLAAKTPGSVWAKIKTFAGAIGYRGLVTIGLGVTLVHYLHLTRLL
jgi:hypothetical protein